MDNRQKRLFIRTNKGFKTKSKRSKIKDVSHNSTTEEWTYPAQNIQHAKWKTDLSKIMNNITLPPSRASKIRKVICSVKQNKIKKDTPSEASAIFFEGDFSRKQ